MKKLSVFAALLSLGVTSTIASAEPVKVRSWDDLSWWGLSGATSDPYPDPIRAGYWWEPSVAASNVDDQELWGNRGVVYSTYYEPTPPAPPPPPPPPRVAPPPAPAPPPVPQRITPVFNNVLFDFDRSTVKPEGREVVREVANQLNENTGDTVTIEGHTDNVNRSGDPLYNMKLGQRRADAIKEVLLEFGIPESRVETVSFGATEPAVPNTTPENRGLNRRVEFVYHLGE